MWKKTTSQQSQTTALALNITLLSPTWCCLPILGEWVCELLALYFSRPRELLLVDTDLGQTVGVISMERAHSPLAAVSVCSTSQHLLLLHESGSVSMWAPKTGLSVASTPMLPKSQSQVEFPLDLERGPM